MGKHEDRFESPDTVELKGKITGVTRLSKKAKALVTIVLVGIVGFIVFSIFSIDSMGKKNSGTKNIQDEKYITKENAVLEPAKPGDLLQGIGDGQVSHANQEQSSHMSKSGFDLAGPTTPTPLLSHTKSDAAVPALPTNHVIKTPQEVAAQQLHDKRQQLDYQAREADFENAHVQGFSKGAMMAPSISSPSPRPQDMSHMSHSIAPNEQNKPTRPEKFLREAENQLQQTVLASVKQPALSLYEIKAGWSIPAMLECGINSDLPGQICARVRENVYDTKTGRHLLIPQGTKLIGTYDSQIAVGQERILAVWTRLIFPDGSSLSLQGMPGADQAGYAGFGAEVNNHYFKLFAGAAMLSIISAGTQLSQPQQSATPNNAPSTQQTVAGALGQQLGQLSMSLTQRNLQIQPTLQQQPGYRFNVILTKDIVFPGIYGQG
jgi:type IV secretion system protein VirB10